MFTAAIEKQHPVSSNTLANITLIGIWFAYLFLKPIYIFPKGLPQPSDMVLLIGLLPGLTFAFMHSNSRIPMAYLIGGLFAALTFLINWVNHLFHPDIRLILSSLYYPYNFMIFIFVIYLFKRDFILVTKASILAITLSVIVQAAWAVYLPDFGLKRMTAGFLNPNQLAYWALLSGGMLFFLKRYEKFSVTDYITLFLILFIQTLALSKAGIFASMSFYTFMSFSPQVHSSVKYIMGLGVVMLALYIAFAPNVISDVAYKIEAFEKVAARLETVGKENDDSPEGRGYNRIVNNPEYLLLGSGEGAFYRFRTWASSNELHSGLATLLFSYGIFGFFLFCAFLYFIFYKQPWYCFAILFSIMLFSITSQTIRFTHTWVFLGMAYATFVIPRQRHTPLKGQEENLSLEPEK